MMKYYENIIIEYVIFLRRNENKYLSNLLLLIILIYLKQYWIQIWYKKVYEYCWPYSKNITHNFFPTFIELLDIMTSSSCIMYTNYLKKQICIYWFHTSLLCNCIILNTYLSDQNVIIKFWIQTTFSNNGMYIQQYLKTFLL